MIFFQKYKEFERAVRVEEIDGLRLVKRLAEDMEEMFHKKAQAMKVLVSTWIVIHQTKPKRSLELCKTFEIQNSAYKSTTKCKHVFKNLFSTIIGIIIIIIIYLSHVL